jgi:hypothetical protein
MIFLALLLFLWLWCYTCYSIFIVELLAQLLYKCQFDRCYALAGFTYCYIFINFICLSILNSVLSENADIWWNLQLWSSDVLHVCFMSMLAFAILRNVSTNCVCLSENLSASSETCKLRRYLNLGVRICVAVSVNSQFLCCPACILFETARWKWWKLTGMTRYFVNILLI